MTQSIVDRFQHFLTCLEIVHHIPGRIRLRLIVEQLKPLNAGAVSAMSAVADVSDFKARLGEVPGVHSIRLNLMAKSCTVEYDQRIIPFDAWPDFLAGIQSDSAAVLATIINDKYAEVSCA